MTPELLCPDCGGVVGATETTDAGAPCRCFADAATAPVPSSSRASGSAPRFSPDSPSDSTVDEPAPVTPAKICVTCGADVTGRGRVKDSRGYQCVECAKKEQRKERGDRVRCRSCGKLVLPASLQNYEGTQMCLECYSARVKVARQTIKRLGLTTVRTREETRKLITLAVIGVLLVLIIVLNAMHLMPRFF